MAEKKKWAPTKMFLQWCLSYLLISVIALTLLLASGYRYLDVLRDNLEYTNGIQLDMTRVWLDQKVKLLRNITAKESSTAAIEAVRQADDYDDIPRYDYYMLTRKISTDVINYGIGDAYFLYFPSTDAIVSNTKYGQSRRFYDLVLEAYDISYEDWMEILKQNLVTTRVFQPVVQGKIFNVGYERVMLLYNPAIYNSADVINTYVYRKGLIDAQFSYSTAVGMFNCLVSFALVMITNKISQKVNGSGLW